MTKPEPKWSWSCRGLDSSHYHLPNQDTGDPRVGDVALVQVRAVGHHTRIANADGEKVRLYPDDMIVGVFGHRYATNAFEGEVCGTDELHMLTDAGMIGTVRSRHTEAKSPTRLRFIGYVGAETTGRLNLKALRFPAAVPICNSNNVILVVGTGMNSGKTTTAAKLIKSLLRRGLRVAACKLTGSVCPRDRGEFSATGAHDTRDFSDYGFPSTYMAADEELLRLFMIMLADAEKARPDIVVMEIADGLLQRETKLLLEHEVVRRRTRGVVLAAPCSASALFGVERIEALGHTLLALSGCITNSPLFMREFTAISPLVVATSVGDGNELADSVVSRFRAAS